MLEDEEVDEDELVEDEELVDDEDDTLPLDDEVEETLPLDVLLLEPPLDVEVEPPLGSGSSRRSRSASGRRWS